MQHETIRQLEDAQAHLSAARDIQQREVWVWARQVGRRQRDPRLREEMQRLVAAVDQVSEHLIEAQRLVSQARGSRKDER